MDKFLKLKDAGGYELLRVGSGGGRTLEVIPIPPRGYSVDYLKDVVSKQKYISSLYKQVLIYLSRRVCLV